MESLEDKSRLVFWDIEALKLQDSENMRFFLEALFYYLRGNGFGTGFHIRPVAANRHHTRVSVAVLNSLHGCGITPEFVRPGADLKLPKQLADRRISSHMFTWMEPERAEPGVVVLLAHDGHYINAIREILRLGHSAVLIYKGSVNTNLYQLPWSGKVNIRYLKRRYARHLREGNPPEGGVGENSDGDSDDDDADDDGHAIGGGDVFPPTPPTTGIFDPIVFANHGFQFVPGGGFRIWHASTGAHQEELELRRWNGEAIGALESDPNDIMRGVYSSGIALNCVPYGTDLIREFTPTERDLLPIMADVEQAVSAAAGVPKEGAFKKFSIKGVELMSTEDLVKLLSSRIRRRFSKGLTRKPMALIKKLRKAKREAPQGEKPEPVRTLLTNKVIVPEMIGSIIGVYNGKTFDQVEITPEMIGHYLAEFSISYKPVKHGRPGVGAAGVPKERAFKKFSIRGVDLDADMSTEDLVKLLSSRIRRRFSKGLTRKPMALIKKLRKAKREAPQGEKPEPVRTLLRNTVIVPEMIGSIIGVYIGKTFNQVEIKPEMIGHYLAEFSISY